MKILKFQNTKDFVEAAALEIVSRMLLQPISLKIGGEVYSSAETTYEGYKCDLNYINIIWPNIEDFSQEDQDCMIITAIAEILSTALSKSSMRPDSTTGRSYSTAAASSELMNITGLSPLKEDNRFLVEIYHNKFYMSSLFLLKPGKKDTFNIYSVISSISQEKYVEIYPYTPHSKMNMDKVLTEDIINTPRFTIMLKSPILSKLICKAPMTLPDFLSNNLFSLFWDRENVISFYEDRPPISKLSPIKMDQRSPELITTNGYSFDLYDMFNAADFQDLIPAGRPLFTLYEDAIQHPFQNLLFAASNGSKSVGISAQISKKFREFSSVKKSVRYARLLTTGIKTKSTRIHKCKILPPCQNRFEFCTLCKSIIADVAVIICNKFKFSKEEICHFLKEDIISIFCPSCYKQYGFNDKNINTAHIFADLSSDENFDFGRCLKSLPYFKENKNILADVIIFAREIFQSLIERAKLYKNLSELAVKNTGRKRTSVGDNTKAPFPCWYNNVHQNIIHDQCFKIDSGNVDITPIIFDITYNYLGEYSHLNNKLHDTVLSAGEKDRPPITKIIKLLVG